MLLAPLTKRKQNDWSYNLAAIVYEFESPGLASTAHSPVALHGLGGILSYLLLFNSWHDPGQAKEYHDQCLR